MDTYLTMQNVSKHFSELKGDSICHWLYNGYVTPFSILSLSLDIIVIKLTRVSSSNELSERVKPINVDNTLSTPLTIYLYTS